MQSDIVITFGLTCYNQKREIVQALESIAAMDCPFPYEIIVGDDGSSDGSVQAVCEFAKTRNLNLRTIVQPRDPAKKYGTGARIHKNKTDIVLAAGGKYCLMGDGDDEWCDVTFVKDAVSILDGDLSISAVLHDFALVYPDGLRKISKLPLSNGGGAFWHYIAYGMYTHFGTFVFRTPSIVHREQFAMRGFDDYSLAYWCAMRGRFYYQKGRVVYNYRQYEGGGWMNYSPYVIDYLEARGCLWAIRNYPGLALPILASRWRNLRNVRLNYSAYPNVLENCPRLSQEEIVRNRKPKTFWFLMEMVSLFAKIGFVVWKRLSHISGRDVCGSDG